MDWTHLTQNGEMLHGSMHAMMKLSIPFVFPAKAKVVTEQQSLKIWALSYRHTVSREEYIRSKK
jgi:hypothetical protein